MSAVLSAVPEQSDPGLSVFYKAVLPAEGHYCLFLLPEARHVWADSFEKLVELTEKYQDRTGVYYATAAYAEPTKRTQANVSMLKALRLDIDAGPAKLAKHGDEYVYATQDEALKDVVRFAKASALPPSQIISSGAGLHVYYTLTDAVTPDVWMTLATALQDQGVAHGLKIDSTTTKDAARVLRPLGALHDNGERVSVRWTGKPWVLEVLADRLSVSTAAPKRVYDLSVNDDMAVRVEGPPASALKIAENCAALKEVAASGGDVQEPHWRAMLGLVKHTVEADDIAQEWSRGHPDYDPAEVERKLAAYGAGPTTCAKFGEYTKACADCKHKGKIKSPIVLGRMTVEELPNHLKPDGPVGITRQQLVTELPDWRLSPDGMRVGAPLPTVANVVAAARITGCTLRYNQMTRGAEVSVPQLKAATDDYKNTALARFADCMVRCGLPRDIKVMADAGAAQSPFHPVSEWIDSKPWDGTTRRAQLHNSIVLRDPTQAPLRAKLIDTFAVSAVAAVYRPEGVAAQGMLVLAGPQGIGKTRCVESLCTVPRSVRTGLHVDPGDKDSVFRATGAWISELGELDGTTRRSDVSALKAFITSPEDILRRPYAATESTYPRRTVFVGTVNGTGFLADDTGSRRFWVLNVTRCHPVSPELIQQIWAEYRVMYEQGAPWHLDAATEAALKESNEEHHTIDPLREQIVAAFDWPEAGKPGWLDAPSTRWLSATEICRVELNMYQPTKSDVTRAGGIVRDLNGNAHRRSGVGRALAVPPRARRFP